MLGQDNIKDQAFGVCVGDRKLRIAAAITYAWLVFTNVPYNFGHPSPWDIDDVELTQITAQTGLVVLYWLFLFFWQFVYLVKFFDATPRSLNLVYVASNLMQLIWFYLFARSHYLLSELVAVLTFGLLLAAFLSSRSYSVVCLATRLVAHGSVVALPLAWTHYIVWWNGAVLASARGGSAQIVTKFFNWKFFAAFGILLLFSGDFILGLASAYLVFAIGVGRVFKDHALELSVAFSLVPRETKSAPVHNLISNA